MFIVPDPVVYTYTISQPLSSTTYSVQSVAINNTPTTNFSVAGQTLTITDTLDIGDTIDVVLTHVVTLQQTYTITAETLSAGGYFLDRVRVDGVTIPNSNYNLSGQNVTFINTNSFSPGDLIQFDLVHTDNGMTTSQILQTINNAGITGLTASQHKIQYS